MSSRASLVHLKHDDVMSSSTSPTTVVRVGRPLPEPLRLAKTDWRVLRPSSKSLRTSNPIRAIVDPIVAGIRSGEERGDGKDPISLALGDPTAAGNLPPCPVAIQAVRTVLDSPSKAAGYINACGLPAARVAIAAHHASAATTVTADHVIVANGCSGALELVLTALLDQDDLLLVPQPGFPLYQVIAESHGAAVVGYRLEPDTWTVDLEHIEELMAEHADRIRGILINNPSNPTGAVYSRQHLRDIVHVCAELQLPIVADEVYGDLVFGENQFHPLAEVAAELGREVPVITTSGIGKQFLLPGWRVGWAVFADNIHGSLREVEAGAKRLAQVILGASHLAQTVVPALLDPGNEEIRQWKQELRETLERQATFLTTQLAMIPGLHVLPAGGAMYTMVRINVQDFDDSIANDLDFSRLLLEEENVFVLPGQCFGVQNVFRAVFCAPEPVLAEAASRMAAFCKRHSSIE